MVNSDKITSIIKFDTLTVVKIKIEHYKNCDNLFFKYLIGGLSQSR